MPKRKAIRVIAMRPKKYDPAQLALLRKSLEDWQMSADGKELCITFKFSNFRRAFAFMSEMALAAEKLDHHPEWSNSYSRVSICLTTHDADGLTELDEKLAKLMTAAASRFDAVVIGEA